VIKIKCSITEDAIIKVHTTPHDEKYHLTNFLTDLHSIRSVLEVLNLAQAAINGTHIKDATSQYDFNTAGFGLNVLKDTIQLQYCIAGTTDPEIFTMPLSVFTKITETYARFLNKHLKARHAKLNWGKEEVAENDKQLKAYFKNKK
jgi:hypothetical protein